MIENHMVIDDIEQRGRKSGIICEFCGENLLEDTNYYRFEDGTIICEYCIDEYLNTCRRTA